MALLNSQSKIANLNSKIDRSGSLIPNYSIENLKSKI
jgi:hypothetical protein